MRKDTKLKIFSWFLLITCSIFFSMNVYAQGVQGLIYKTWASSGASPAIPTTTPLTTGIVSNINFQWGNGVVLNSGRADGVIVNFSGYYKVPGTGLQTYSFGIDSDDGQILKINGTTLVNCWCDQGSGFRYGTITLQGGSVVPIDVWFYENGGGAFVKVFWLNPDGIWEIIPTGNFGTTQEFLNPTVTSQGTSSNITLEQQDTVDTTRLRVTNIILGNRIDIEEKIGSSGNNVTIEQSGNYNVIQGFGNNKAILNGSNNTLDIKQGSIIGKNLIEFNIQGNSNSLIIRQARNVNTGAIDGLESGGHYAGTSLIGNGNSVTVKQGNEGANNSGHFSLLSVSGNNNNLTVLQSNNNDKKFFGSIFGSNNIFSLNQIGDGNHFVDLMLNGSGHNVTVLQKESGSHKATINLQNIGGSSTLNLTQQGTIGQQYNIMQQCANLSGCSVTVTQGTVP